MDTQRELYYYALYRTAQGWRTGEPPVGIVVETTESGQEYRYHAMMWSHRNRGWDYDPAGARRIMRDEAYRERRLPIDRAQAEAATPGFTDGERLPDEDTIRWFFQWQGNPPRT